MNNIHQASWWHFKELIMAEHVYAADCEHVVTPNSARFFCFLRKIKIYKEKCTKTFFLYFVKKIILYRV